MPDITVKGPNGPPVSYALDRESVTVGRASGSHILVRDHAVSRCHLRLWRDATRWMVGDEGSRHGTLVNGEPLIEPRAMRKGDEITIGHTTLVFDAAVRGAVHEGDDLPTASLVPWSGRGTGTGDDEPVMVGRSAVMGKVQATIDTVAPSMATVLITGENGTGKELVARLLHRRSGRAAEPFVVVNCPALPGTLVEAELFGVEKGAATGVEPRIGRFEAAGKGTLFLDEVGDLDAAAQAKLLRTLGEGTIERVGGHAPLPVHARVVAATNHDLRADVERGSFRRDLYHRLDTVVLTLPPLRERRDDIPLLVQHFAAHGAGPSKPLAPEALELLSRYAFPGNVRELEHVIEHAQLLAPGRVVEAEDLPQHVREGAGSEGEASMPSVVDHLHERVVRGGESFWEAVQAPYLRREISKEDVRRLVERVHAEAGHSYLEMARLLRLEPEYRKLLNFLHYHGLRVGR